MNSDRFQVWVKQWLRNKCDLRQKVVLSVSDVVIGDWSLNPAQPAAPGRRLEVAPAHEVMSSMPSSEESCGNGRGGKKELSPVPM